MRSFPDTLHAFGWTDFFAQQCGPDEADLTPQRIARVHRAHVGTLSPEGPLKLALPPHTSTADFAVGDWVLVDPDQATVERRLERHSLLQRHTVGARTPQLIAANVDTLFIVTSCNEDFNVARLERYLALANEAGTTPVIVLTKADQTADVPAFAAGAAALQRGLEVTALNAKDAQAATTLAPWCGADQTVALVGSSGVGKSTLLNTLVGDQNGDPQETGAIREDDAKGRHTTTARSLHAMKNGGWAIDTPGIRTLHISDLDAGLDVVFAEITDHAPHCRFRDCTHAHEPGCAVQTALAQGQIDPARLDRWRKLTQENAGNGPDQAGPQARAKPAPRGKRR